MALTVKDAAGTTRTTGVDHDGDASYQYSVADFAPVAAATAMFILQGSATKVVRVKKIAITGAATAAGSAVVSVTKRSSAGTTTSATLTAVTAAKRDSGSGAATAVLSKVSVANVDVLGTSAGVVGSGRVCLTAIGAAATSFGVQPLVFEWGTKGDMPLVLRGTSEFLTIDGLGVALVSGAKYDVNIETVESDA